MQETDVSVHFGDVHEPLFQLFQRVRCISQVDRGLLHIGDGIIVGFSLSPPGAMSGWWYDLMFTSLIEDCFLPLPYRDWVAEDELQPL